MIGQREDTTSPAWSSRPGDEMDGLLVALLATTREIVGCERVADAWSRIAEGAVAVVPGVRDIGVVVRGPAGTAVCGAHTTETAATLDRAQIRTAEGPCIDAFAGSVIVVLPDTATETRWPRFVREAARHGVRAGLSVPLAGGCPAGTVNLYLARHALDDPAVRTRVGRLAQVFVAHASLALAGASRVEALESALVRRDVIGQAKGVLMNRYHVDADEAFDRLRRASQTTNTKLYDVATWLAACRTPDPGCEADATAAPRSGGNVVR